MRPTILQLKTFIQRENKGNKILLNTSFSCSGYLRFLIHVMISVNGGKRRREMKNWKEIANRNHKAWCRKWKPQQSNQLGQYQMKDLSYLLRINSCRKWNQASLCSNPVGIPIELKDTLLFLSAGVLV